MALVDGDCVDQCREPGFMCDCVSAIFESQGRLGYDVSKTHADDGSCFHPGCCIQSRVRVKISHSNGMVRQHREQLSPNPDICNSSGGRFLRAETFRLNGFRYSIFYRASRKSKPSQDFLYFLFRLIEKQKDLGSNSSLQKPS